ncbi:carboxylesterase family protein [Mariniblastus fucicola]|uniref:Esterase n=1 Tax=Mariniblastus fucicola TaxID=980251 RepID=A0A5B9P7J0_9BACT|nr:alpha/beta hydrolase-fold protein [Mariniblastus fucicola]QEG21469.1 esterase [Mariniblastus fucicola]
MKNLLTLSLALFVSLTFIAQQTTAQDAESNEPKPAKQVELIFKTSDGAEVGYLLYLPKNYDPASETKAPFMLFLHGRGESNGPLSLVAKWGPPKKVAAGEDFPFVMVSPQCPREDYWSSETQLSRLTELLADVKSKHVFDENRIYLTGLSMGGYGSWSLANKHPEMFAAVAPICGGGKAEYAGNLKDIPIWTWHGDQDGAVPYKLSVEMVDAIKEAGGSSIKFTSLEGIGHNCWSAAYATPQLYQWMLKQSNKTE